MIKPKYIIIGIFLFVLYIIIEYSVLAQDRTTRKYRTTIKTLLDEGANTINVEQINSIHGTFDGILHILYSFRYNVNILETQVQTQQGKKKVKDYIFQTVDKKELQNLYDQFDTTSANKENLKRQIAFMLLQGRLYFTFDKANNKSYTYIHFIHSDTTFAREYIMLNIDTYNKAISNRKIPVFRDKFALIEKDFNETKSKIDAILTEIATHKDTRTKLVKEVGGLDLIKYRRAMEVEEELLSRKKESAALVFLISMGEVRQLLVVQEPTFKDNTANEHIIKMYIAITSFIYTLLTLISANFIARKYKIYKDWLIKQNIL